MSVEFFNAYVERLIKEVTELTKNRLLLETQLQMTEKVNADLLTKIKELEDKVNIDTSTKKVVSKKDTF
jgi:hypothetical protein